MPPRYLLGEVFLYVLRGGGGPGTDPEHAGETTCLDVPALTTHSGR